jgi:hypothetical protein
MEPSWRDTDTVPEDGELDRITTWRMDSGAIGSCESFLDFECLVFFSV